MIMECGDFLEFQDSLKKMRDVDDKIVYALNASVPSPSFRNEINPTKTCEELFNKLHGNHLNREKSIRNCINITSEKVRALKEKRGNEDEMSVAKSLFKEKRGNEDEMSVAKSLNKEQTKLRMLKSELNVEEVVRNRSLKLFYERCRGFYKPKDLIFE